MGGKTARALPGALRGGAGAGAACTGREWRLGGGSGHVRLSSFLLHFSHFFSSFSEGDLFPRCCLDGAQIICSGLALPFFRVKVAKPAILPADCWVVCFFLLRGGEEGDYTYVHVALRSLSFYPIVVLPPKFTMGMLILCFAVDEFKSFTFSQTGLPSFGWPLPPLPLFVFKKTTSEHALRHRSAVAHHSALSLSLFLLTCGFQAAIACSSGSSTPNRGLVFGT